MGDLATGFVDLPADPIKDAVEDAEDVAQATPLPDAPRGGVEEARLFKITQFIQSAKAPLAVIGRVLRRKHNGHIPLTPASGGN